MHDTHYYDCIIHTELKNREHLKGPVVDLKLMNFCTENLVDDLPFYWYEIYLGNYPIGKISLRLGYNEITMINGHVGYEIDEPYRGHNYGYYALELIKTLAMDHGFRYLIVTTTIDNFQSQKTIMRAKGQLILSEYEVPKSHILYVLGKPKMNIYEITLG